MPGCRTSPFCGRLLVVLALAVLSACSGPEAIESAHAVFMTRPGCPYVVTNERQNNFAVLTPRDDFAPSQGDLLVGNLRNGLLSLQVAPFGEEEITRTVPFEIAGHGLSLAEAQGLFYGFCPPPAAPPPSPDLPPAPEGVPPMAPPDTAGTF